MSAFKLKQPLLIGRGPWGRTIERTLKALGATPLIAGKDAIEYLKAGLPMVDSIIIATPVSTHWELLRFARDTELPVFVEKPIVTSVEQKRYLQQLWYPSQPILTDFTYCWSAGFEALMNETRSRTGTKFIIDACFGGDVVHSDCHPVWDYGSHIVALMLLLGADDFELKNLKMKPPRDGKYVLDGPHYTVTVHVGEEVNKLRRLTVKTGYGDDVGSLRGTSWKVGSKYYDDGNNPPLTRALSSFLKLENTNDARWGLELPSRVTTILETWIPCNGREAVKLLTEETERLGGYVEEMKK